MNKREVKEALADQDWWQELEVVPGWTLYGWSYRQHASFRTGPHTTIEIRGHERDAILAAIKDMKED